MGQGGKTVKNGGPPRGPGGGRAREDSRLGGIRGVINSKGVPAFMAWAPHSFTGVWSPLELPTAPAPATANTEHLLQLFPHWPLDEHRLTHHHLAHKRRGYQTHMQLILDVQLNAGTGSNQWHVTAEFLRNPETNRHSWASYPAPRGSVWVEPRYFTDTDLPIQRRLFIDRRTCCGGITLRFNRYGAGTNSLYVRRLATHGGA